MAERPFEPVPNTPLVADPTGDAIWKRWLQGLQRFLGNAVRGPGSSTDNAVARWDGTSGTFLNNSGVIIDDSNNVTGIEDLTVNGDTTLGSAAADTLTINCQDWTFGADWRGTRDAGTVGAGVQNIQTFNSTFTGHSGGTTDVRALRNISTTLDGNDFAVVQAFVSSYTHLGTGTITTSRNNFSPTILNAAGSVTNARGFETLFTLSSSGNITTADAFFASAPVMSATGTITTLNGLRVGNLGNSLVTNAIGLKVDNFTGSSVMIGVQSSLSAASGKHNLYIDGTADNSFAGPIYPAQDGKTIQTAAAIYAGTGAPNNANGNDGDFYMRGDGTVAGNNVMYHKEAGAWVAFTTT